MARHFAIIVIPVDEGKFMRVIHARNNRNNRSSICLIPIAVDIILMRKA